MEITTTDIVDCFLVNNLNANLIQQTDLGIKLKGKWKLRIFMWNMQEYFYLLPIDLPDELLCDNGCPINSLSGERTFLIDGQSIFSPIYKKKQIRIWKDRFNYYLIYDGEFTTVIPCHK